MSEVTRILSAISQGDPSAASQLLPLVYDELRNLAAHRLAQQTPGQTFQPTALVHEAYLRLVGDPGSGQGSRSLPADGGPPVGLCPSVAPARSRRRRAGRPRLLKENGKIIGVIAPEKADCLMGGPLPPFRGGQWGHERTGNLSGGPRQGPVRARGVPR